jgi:hypothetical protein
MRWLPILAVVAVLLVPGSAGAGGGADATPAGSLYFNDVTDTIQIEGQTVLGTDATYEALVYFPAGAGAGGTIFNEWTIFLEDKLLAAGPGGLTGYAFSTGPLAVFNTASTFDSWLHVAYVKDESVDEQRLYLDGSLVATSAASGDIGDGGGSGYIGSIFRDGVQAGSFTGFIDTFRISDNARYSGASFTAPTGDLVDDANTVLLYNFNEPDFFIDQGQVKIADLSGNGLTGTLGTAGQGTPTSPEPPANLGDVDCSGAINSVDALKLLRSNAALSVSQTEPCPDVGENLLPGLFGDVDCSGAVNSVDALKVLRYSAGLTVEQTQPCPAFGDPI